MGSSNYKLGTGKLFIVADDKKIEIPCATISFELNVETIEHFSNRMGLRSKEHEIISGYSGTIDFVPCGEMQISIGELPVLATPNVKQEIGSMLDEVLKQQRLNRDLKEQEDFLDFDDEESYDEPDFNEYKGGGDIPKYAHGGLVGKSPTKEEFVKSLSDEGLSDEQIEKYLNGYW